MFFPVFVDLTKKHILVIGAGKIASRRICVLHRFAGCITVVAPAICAKIENLAKENQDSFHILRRAFEPSDLDGMDMVLAATDDALLNREIGALCKERGIFANVASAQEQCDFQFPSVISEGEIVVGINASGKDHRLVKETRKKIEKCLLEEDGKSFYV